MDQSPVMSDEPPSESGRPVGAWWRRRPLWAGAAVLVVVAGAAGWLAVSGGDSPAPAPPARTVDVAGLLRVPFFGGSLGARDTARSIGDAPQIYDPCVTVGGFTDITESAAVTIGGDRGQVVQVGALSNGTVAAGADGSAVCEFAFSVYVPAGLPEYTVTVSHRGTQVFTPEQVAAGITLTLG